MDYRIDGWTIWHLAESVAKTVRCCRCSRPAELLREKIRSGRSFQLATFCSKHAPDGAGILERLKAKQTASG